MLRSSASITTERVQHVPRSAARRKRAERLKSLRPCRSQPRASFVGRASTTPDFLAAYLQNLPWLVWAVREREGEGEREREREREEEKDKEKERQRQRQPPRHVSWLVQDRAWNMEHGWKQMGLVESSCLDDDAAPATSSYSTVAVIE